MTSFVALTTSDESGLYPAARSARLGLRALRCVSKAVRKRVTRLVEDYRLVRLMEDVDETQPNTPATDPCSRHGHAGTSRKEGGMEQGKHSNSTGTGRHQPWEESTHQGYPLSPLTGSHQQLSSNLHLPSRLEMMMTSESARNSHVPMARLL